MLLPLVQKLKKGKAMGKAMQDKVGPAWSEWLLAPTLQGGGTQPAHRFCAGWRASCGAPQHRCMHMPLARLQVTEIEGLLAKLDGTKKHLGNAEFVQAMGKKKQVGAWVGVWGGRHGPGNAEICLGCQGGHGRLSVQPDLPTECT